MVVNRGELRLQLLFWMWSPWQSESIQPSIRYSVADLENGVYSDTQKTPGAVCGQLTRTKWYCSVSGEAGFLAPLTALDPLPIPEGITLPTACALSW